MRRTIVGMYSDRDVAERVVRDLLSGGISRDDVAVAVDEPARRYRELSTLSDRRRERRGTQSAAVMAFVGALVGIGLALLIGMALDPGYVLGPNLTSSVILSGIIGAVVGLAVGWAGGAGTRRGVPIPTDHPEAARIQERGVVVGADVPRKEASRIVAIMERHQPVDIDRRARSWRRREGWRALLAPVPTRTVLSRSADEERRAHHGPGFDEQAHLDAPPGAVEAPPGAVEREGRSPSPPIRERLAEEGIPAEPHHERTAMPEHERPAPTERPPRPDRPLGAQPRHEPITHRPGRATPRRRPEATEAHAVPEPHAPALSSLQPHFRRHFERANPDESWEVQHEAYETGARLAWDSRSKPFASFHDVESLARMRWESGPHGDIPFRRVRDAIVYGFEEGRLTFA